MEEVGEQLGDFIDVVVSWGAHGGGEVRSGIDEEVFFVLRRYHIFLGRGEVSAGTSG